MKGERGGEHENKRADLRDATTARPASCASRNSSPPVIDAQTEGKQRQDRRREARKERRTSIPGIVLDEQAALVAGYPQAGGGVGGPMCSCKDSEDSVRPLPANISHPISDGSSDPQPTPAISSARLVTQPPSPIRPTPPPSADVLVAVAGRSDTPSDRQNYP